MNLKRLTTMISVLALAIAGMRPAMAEEPATSKPAREPDIHFVPTPHEVVEVMLRLADVKTADIVYDLGCGDGRIVIAAAKKVGCKAIGYDIDPEMVAESRRNVKAAGVEHLVTIEEADVFTLDLSGASVVTLYLLPELNVRLIPQLEKLKPGSRIVSHEFDMAGVTPDVTAVVNRDNDDTSNVYLWTTPLKKDRPGTALGERVWNEPDPGQLRREDMVVKQIVERGITNPAVLEAMRAVARHEFVPAAVREQAYDDMPLPIGDGQTISQPYIVALMTDKLGLNDESKVLEIGTGSGYQAAVLAELCAQVYTIEIVESLGRRAEQALNDLGYDNVKVRIGDGHQGWPEHAPFDAVMVTCAPTKVPQPLVDQLKDGGRMIIPVGESGQQELVLLIKRGGKMVEEKIIPVRFVPMVDAQGKTY